MNKLYRIELSYAVFGLITDDTGTIIRTAPISRKSLGRNIQDVIRYYVNNRNTEVDDLGEI